MLQQRRHCHKCDYCYSPVTRNYVRSIYQEKNQAMRGQYGHLNNCKEYARQKLLSVQQERNVLTNQFPVVENGPFSSIMQMEEYSSIYAPDEPEMNAAGMDEPQGNVVAARMDEAAENNRAGMDQATGNVGAGMDEADGNHFQKLLLENLYDYFGNARQRRPNRTKGDIEAGMTVNVVNNRTLARFFCYATEWQLPAEGLFDLFLRI